MKIFTSLSRATELDDPHSSGFALRQRQDHESFISSALFFSIFDSFSTNYHLFVNQIVRHSQRLEELVRHTQRLEERVCSRVHTPSSLS